MEYVLGDAPILDEGRKVIVNLPNASIKGVIVGMAGIDDSINPMYIVKCTDGQIPDSTYHYSCFTAVLGTIELDNE